MSHHPGNCATRLQVVPDVFGEALRLQRIGISVIPIGQNKRPAVRWKPFQREAADEHQLWDWWASRDDLGIAIVLGAVSGNLCGRDFDDQQSFDDWLASHRTLARELPIACSRRGGHVYFRCLESLTTKLVGGEIRANGSYLIAPPSCHPTGFVYSWMNPLVSLPRLVNPVEAGLHQPKPAAKGSSVRHEETALGNTIGASLETAVANAIRATLPRRFGERNDLIWAFARRLKALPDLHGLAGRDVLAHAEDWFRSALPFISTKEWLVTRSAFLSAWPRITHPFTDGTLRTCLADVDASIPSPIALRYLNDPVTVRLIGLCERLQRIAGGEPFFLSTEACHLFGQNHKMQLGRRLERLRDDGVLVRLTIGNSIQRRASEYRYLPTIQETEN